MSKAGKDKLFSGATARSIIINVDIAALIVLLLASYFAVAALVPRLRVRWGLRKGVRITTLLPRIGAITCVGMATLMGSFTLLFHWRNAPPEWIKAIVVAGLIVIVTGTTVDWIREPTLRRRNR